MLQWVKQQLKHATASQRPAKTCFLLNQKQPPQPLCMWMATTGSSLRWLPKTDAGDVTSSLSLSPSHTHSLPPSLPLSLSSCVPRLESSSDSVHLTSGSGTQTQNSRTTALFLIYKSSPTLYIWAQDMGAGIKKRRWWWGGVLSCPCTHQQPLPFTSMRVVDELLPRGAF